VFSVMTGPPLAPNMRGGHYYYVCRLVYCKYIIKICTWVKTHGNPQ
jgi:hypothetical protein